MARRDADIAREAVAALRSRPLLSADKIKVVVKEGWIALQGEVEWNYQREEAVFEALEFRRVRTLAVDDGFAIPGDLCPVCGRLQKRGRTECITSENPRFSAVEVAVEIAIEQALQQDASFELVRSRPVRQRMLQRAPIGALLRWL
jgi:peptide subunit release factor 1 (eRF1)